MREWWQGLQPREQWVLLAGVVGVGVLMLYALVFDPYQKEGARLRGAVAEKRASLAAMQQSSGEIAALRGQGAAGQLAAGQSIMGVVDSSAKQFNIGAGIKRIQPEGDHTVKVWAEQVAFDDLVRWLDELQRRYGIAIHDISIEAQEATGRVNVRMDLRGGA